MRPQKEQYFTYFYGTDAVTLEMGQRRLIHIHLLPKLFVCALLMTRQYMIISSISSPIGGGERSASSILLRCIPVIDVLTRPCSFLCPALSCRFDFSPSLDRLQKTWQDLVSVRWWYDWVLSTDRMESTNLSDRPNLVQQKSVFFLFFFG